MTNLTPAEQGIIAAAMDDAFSLQMGDDDTIEYVATAILGQVTDDAQIAWEIAAREFYTRVRGRTTSRRRT